MDLGNAANRPRLLRLLVSGAITGVSVREAEKWIAARQYVRGLRLSTSLSEKEIGELVYFEFWTGPNTVLEQMYRYFLKVKSNNPVKAQEMWKSVEAVFHSDARMKDKIPMFAGILSRYISGFVLRYDEERLSSFS